MRGESVSGRYRGHSQADYKQHGVQRRPMRDVQAQRAEKARKAVPAGPRDAFFPDAQITGRNGKDSPSKLIVALSILLCCASWSWVCAAQGSPAPGSRVDRVLDWAVENGADFGAFGWPVSVLFPAFSTLDIGGTDRPRTHRSSSKGRAGVRLPWKTCRMGARFSQSLSSCASRTKLQRKRNGDAYRAD